MRHLPPLEVGNEIVQVAFPDVHAIALADAYIQCDLKSREDA